MGIAVAFKTSQSRSGHYSFSAAASITICEAVKLGLAICLRARELRAERGAYTLLDVEFGEGKRDASYPADGGPVGRSGRGSVDLTGLMAGLERRTVNGAGLPAGSTSYLAAYASLALLYAGINHTAYLVFRLADPGTVTLVKSSATILSAIILRLFLARGLAELQWHSLIVQLLAMAISQMGRSAACHEVPRSLRTVSLIRHRRTHCSAA